jgi:hypothetical protein
VYEKYRGRMLKPLVDPFQQAGDFQYNAADAGVRIGRLLGPLMDAAAMNNARQLRLAWKAVLAAGRPEELVKELSALPDDLKDNATALATAKTLAKDEVRAEVVSKWQAFWRAKYEAVAAKASGR